MFEKLVEQVIRDAIDRGELDNLPGAGKPVNLDAYFETPPESRVALGVLSGAGVPPPEVELLGKIHELQEALAGSATGDERIEQATEIRALRLRLELLNELGRSRRQHR